MDYSLDETKISIPQKFISTAKTIREFCSEIFPDIKQVVNLQSDDKSWHDWLMERAIICPTNKEVQQINDLVLDEFPGVLHTYYSHETCLTEDQVICFKTVETVKLLRIVLIILMLCAKFQQHAFSQEVLNKIELSGMPPHLIRLKAGMPIMLTSNLDPTRGHCNGTRYIVRGLSPRVIFAEVAIGPYRGENSSTFSCVK